MTDFQLFYDAINMKETERVPSFAAYMNFPAKYCGKSMLEFVKNEITFRECFLKVLEDFPCDMVLPSTNGGINLTKGLGINLSTSFTEGIKEDSEAYYHQFVEHKIMEDEDYDFFLNPRVTSIQFLTKVIIPRSYGIDPKDRKKVKEVSGGFLGDVMEKLQGEKAMVMEDMDLNERLSFDILIEQNVPMYIKGVGVPPLDLLSFLFRGLENLSCDLYRIPQKVIDFCEKWGEFMNMIIIRESNKFKESFNGIESAINKYTPGAVIFLERAFSLSPKHFDKFYLPTLNTQVEELIKNKFRPILICEGNCTHLLKSLAQLPGPNKCSILVDTSDIIEVKKILGDYMSIIGNVPQTLLMDGSPSKVDKYCKNLIENVGAGGGFILGPALLIPDEAKPENVKTMVESVHKYKTK